MTISDITPDDKKWRRAIQSLAREAGIGADRYTAFDADLYDLWSEYRISQLNHPGRPRDVRQKVAKLKHHLDAALAAYKDFGQGLVVRYWWTAYRALWRKSNRDVSMDIDTIVRMNDAAMWVLRNREGGSGAREARVGAKHYQPGLAVPGIDTAI